MRWLLHIPLLLAFGIGAAAQTAVPEHCPNIELRGPQGILRPGESIPFSVVTDQKAKNFSLQYRWTSSNGEIIAGQGTASIKIKWPETTTLTVTVELQGMPNDCAASLSETAHWDPPPQPIRIGVLASLKTGEFEEKLRSFAVEISANPTNQLYIFLSSALGTSPSAVAEWEQQIKDALPSGLRTRTSITEVPGGRNIIEFWRIPPGADTPNCESCSTSACPNITVVGPAGLTRPGDTMRFTANPPLKRPAAPSFRWTISAGAIIQGQGTPSIEVQTIREMNFTSVTATVEVSGLPNNCSGTASETAGIAAGHPYPMDEFGRLPLNDIKGRLDNLLHYVAQTNNQNGYIVLRHPKGAPRAKLRQRIQRITDHVFKLRKFPRNRIVILVEPADQEYTVLWQVTPDFGKHICPECEKY